MGRSMHLSEELKEQTDRLYNSDPAKYIAMRINAWIGQGRKEGFTESEMAAALRDFQKSGYHLADEWYPYLDMILKRVIKDRNIASSDQEHLHRKAEEAQALHGEFGDLVKSLADAKKA